MLLTIVVAMDGQGLIGSGGALPWHLPEDLKHFKRLTSNYPIIMGRKTFESIGRPLPKRLNVVVSSHTAEQFPEGVEVVPALQSAIALAEAKGYEKAFLIGGRGIFAEGLEKAAVLAITEIDGKFAGEVYFPEVDWTNWSAEEVGEWQESEKGLMYRILYYHRKQGE